jgi:hypothetical protein
MPTNEVLAVRQADGITDRSPQGMRELWTGSVIAAPSSYGVAVWT